MQAVKAALRHGKQIGIDGCEIKIELLASPIYVLRTQTMDKNLGVAALKQSIELIQAEMSKYDRGEAKVKDGGEPRCVTNYDDVDKMVAAADDSGNDTEDSEFEEGISDAGIQGLELA